MKHTHRVSNHVTPEMHNDFARAGIIFGPGFDAFDITEDDEAWPRVRELIAKHKCVDFESTKFTKKEIGTAPNADVTPSWHHGYPQPEDDFGYLEATFDLSDHCRACGIGKRQIAPFRFKKEPAWGKRSVLQLNWVFDEYFTTPETWDAVFRPRGIESMPVVHHRKSHELSTVVQLAVPDRVDLVGIEAYPSEVCEKCGRRKYLPIRLGFFPSPEPSTCALAKSNQYFGSGGSAFNSVIADNAMVNVVLEAKLKGVSFWPCG